MLNVLQSFVGTCIQMFYFEIIPCTSIIIEVASVVQLKRLVFDKVQNMQQLQYKF